MHVWALSFAKSVVRRWLDIDFQVDALTESCVGKLKPSVRHQPKYNRITALCNFPLPTDCIMSLVWSKIKRLFNAKIEIRQKSYLILKYEITFLKISQYYCISQFDGTALVGPTVSSRIMKLK